VYFFVGNHGSQIGTSCDVLSAVLRRRLS
jgi:hypothetical protein